jgi:DNA polymerase III subunit delta'
MLYKWNIIGHEKQLVALERDIKDKALSHAYLFAGPEKVGKFTVAKKLAHILQCPNNFCHTCPTCKQITKGGHPDTIEMRNDGSSIKIEHVRDLISRLHMTTSSNYKIFLAEDIERMTPEAANCLLKTLEDPPPQVIFICSTTNVRVVLPTIVSRMRIIKFRSFSDSFLKHSLGSFFPEADEETLKQVAALSMGKSGRAFKLMRDGELLSHFRKIYNDVLRLLSTETVSEKFSYVKEIFDDPRLTSDFLDVLLHVLRNRVISDRDHDKSVCLKNIETVQSTMSLLKKNVNARIALENLMLSL